MLHIQSRTLKDTVMSWVKYLIASAAAVFVTAGLVASANATVVAGCNFDTTTTTGTWSLQADCITTGPINITDDNIILEGNNHTISAGYLGSPSNAGDGRNTVIGVIGADNVTINDLTVDGTSGTGLHGINVYDSTDVVLNDVAILNNDKSGLVVNSSIVTVNNLTTSGNTWHGVNVDQKIAGTPATLTINGLSSHNEALQVYLDDKAKLVTVIDTENQYIVTDPQIPNRPNDANYVLKSFAKASCKNGGYAALGFKNQGQCVSSVVSKQQ